MTVILRTGAVPDTREALSALERGDGFMPPELYLSSELFELELREVFPRSWVYVGDAGLLRQPGDFLTETVGYEPIVVLRDREGTLRAFSNVCTHRASLLLDGRGNCGRTLTCPYHGWNFGLDGKLLGVPYQKGFGQPLDREALALHEIRVDVWERFVFVNISGDAPPLLEYLAPLPDQLAGHELASAEPTYGLDDDVDVNWKVMIDNAYCDYHLPFVHGTSIGRYADAGSVTEEVWTYTGRITTTWKPEELARVHVKPGLCGQAASGALAFSVFPNWFVAAFPSGGASVMWWTPTAPERTRARVQNYAIEAASDPRADLAQLRAVQDEDFAICRRVQAGLRSGRYRPGPRHALELRIKGFQSMLLSMLAQALERRSV
jgi:phenylpropionate dioxygenase-like ring-hydroxylating dioxygenase large terminal subunit